MRWVKSSIALYAVVAVLTYGNAVWWIGPWLPEGHAPLRGPVFFINAPVVAALWPLYWSVRLQEPKP